MQVTLASPESDSETLSPVSSPSHQTSAEKPSAGLTAPYRGISVLPAPDGDLPYTLPGDVWPMKYVLDLDTSWITVNGSLKVREILPSIKSDIEHNAMYDKVRRSMETYGQRVPVRIFSEENKLRDGIHRIAIADMIGWETMLVGTEISTWHEWDQSIEGLDYWNLWRMRMGVTR